MNEVRREPQYLINIYVNDKRKLKKKTNHNNWERNVRGQNVVLNDNKENLKNAFHHKTFLWNFVSLCLVCGSRTEYLAASLIYEVYVNKSMHMKLKTSSTFGI